jgi:hypothetical protein
VPAPSDFERRESPLDLPVRGPCPIRCGCMRMFPIPGANVCPEGITEGELLVVCSQFHVRGLNIPPDLPFTVAASEFPSWPEPRLAQRTLHGEPPPDAPSSGDELEHFRHHRHHRHHRGRRTAWRVDPEHLAVSDAYFLAVTAPVPAGRPGFPRGSKLNGIAAQADFSPNRSLCESMNPASADVSGRVPGRYKHSPPSGSHFARRNSRASRASPEIFFPVVARAAGPPPPRNRPPPSRPSCGESRDLCPAAARPARSSHARSPFQHAPRRSLPPNVPQFSGMLLP